MENIQLFCGDCLEVMKGIPDGSVDLVLTDPPYGTTQCNWDSVIPFEPMWEQLKRVCKENAAIVLFSAQPFTTDLISSNRKMFRYEIIWEKTQAQGFLNANKMPLRAHENLVVFYRKLPTYNPVKKMVERKDIGRIRQVNAMRSQQYREMDRTVWVETGERYPTDVIRFSNWNGALFGKTQKHIKHPTAKPVNLLEYIINTYTNDGETVLDFTMGSGSTGVACINTNRRFIGIEKDRKYFEIAKNRIESEVSQLRF